MDLKKTLTDAATSAAKEGKEDIHEKIGKVVVEAADNAIDAAAKAAKAKLPDAGDKVVDSVAKTAKSQVTVKNVDKLIHEVEENLSKK